MGRSRKKVCDFQKIFCQKSEFKLHTDLKKLAFRMARDYEKEESKEQQRRRDVQKEAKKLRHFLEDYDDEKDDVKYYKWGFHERTMIL